MMIDTRFLEETGFLSKSGTIF